VTKGGGAYKSYAYDGNGNATSDGGSKGISYNLLNLPLNVTTGGTTLATYVYDAGGNKLRNTGTDGTWDYINGIVYNNKILFVQTEEGRALPNGNTYLYQYYLKDHLRNTRVTFTKNSSGLATNIQENEYYAFGLAAAVPSTPSPANRYLYNGKEVQTDLTNQYDYGARFYDPVIARWTAVDPLAEESRRWSPYNYGENNPIRNIDPDGMMVTDADGSQHSESEAEAQAMFKQLQAQQQTQDGGKDKKKYDPKAKAAKAAQDKKDKEAQEKKDKDSKGSLAGTILLGTLAIDGGLLADDVTGVGVVDDVAIVPVTVVGGAAAALTELVDLGIDAYLFFAEHTSGKRKSTEQKHTARRSGKTYDKAQNNKRGEKNQKFKPKPNPNKTGN